MPKGCPKCGTEQLVVRIDDGTGGYIYPPVDGNIITLPAETPETVFDALEGPGISITPAGGNGHQPTIGVCLVDGGGLVLDDDNCLGVETGSISPVWDSPNSAAPSQGIVVYPGGVDGHSPSFGVTIHPDSENVSFVDGQLLVECCPDTPWQGATGDGLTITPGDNPAGEAGNGHRPSLNLLVDGVTVGFNGNGELVALGGGGGGGGGDLCADIQALPAPPAGVNILTTVGVGDDGNCYQTTPSDCVVTVDAAGAQWDDQNPNWIDPVSVSKWCELRVDNGVTGCELWRRLEDTQGDPQWAQLA